MPTLSRLKLIASLSVPLFVAFFGSWLTVPEIPTWYASLVKPALNPPAWIFGPVWTILYIMMGLAWYMVWSCQDKARAVRLAVGIFLVQLALNFAWSILFFKWHEPRMALIEIGVMWVAIMLTIGTFARVSAPAAWLLVPYLAWVSFAAYLNYMIVVLN